MTRVYTVIDGNVVNLRGQSEPNYYNAARWFDSKPFVPHPSTEPGVIRATHKAIVLAARDQWPDATPEELSARVDLPVWNVLRALGVERAKSQRTTAGINCKMFPPKGSVAERNLLRLVALLKLHPHSTLAFLAAKMGCHANSVGLILAKTPGFAWGYEAYDEAKATRNVRPRKLWRIADAQATAVDHEGDRKAGRTPVRESDV